MGSSNFKVLDSKSHSISFNMFRAFTILSFLAVASFSLEEGTTPLPRCQNFECPDNSPEGGLWPDGDGCSGTFCECSYGIPYQLECEEANPPLFFNPAQEVCDWCFNMCDTCGSKCPACK